MAMTQQELDQLRAEFREVRDWNEARAIWTPVDSDEYAAHIKACLEAGDPQIIASVRQTIAADCESVRRLKSMGTQRMRALEARIRAERDTRARAAA